MGNLDKVMPTESETVTAIERYWKQRGEAEPPRGYLGASSIGKDCSRQLWYEFRKCSKPEFDGRLYRLFNRGHREEATFAEELRGIGCEVHEVNRAGEQFEVVACDGHFKGHTDGAALGIPEAPKTWHLLEMKTASNKSFNATKKHGVEKDKPVHFAQMQVYMHLTGLTRALYMVVNKDSDRLYTERVRYDKKRAEAYIQKAHQIINSSTPPERISEKPESFACRFCDAKSLCHGTGETAVPVPELHCRQCIHATPIAGGAWSCDLHGAAEAPCKDHRFIPSLVGFAEPTDAFEDDSGTAIEFTTEDGTIWHHGANYSAGQFSSQMLLTMPKSLVSIPNLKQSGIRQNLEARYETTNEGIEVVWQGRTSSVKAEFERRYSVPMTNPDATQDGDGWSIAEFKAQKCCAINLGGRLAEIREDKNT
jgi:hypothetical protein